MSFLPPSEDRRRRDRGDDGPGDDGPSGNGSGAGGSADDGSGVGGSSGNGLGDDDARPGTAAAEQEPRSGRREVHREQRRDRTRRVRRAYALTALGTLVPGAGLTLTRRRGLGLAILLLATAGLLAAAWYVLSRGALDSALDLASRPNLLQALGAALVVGGLVWVGSIALTASTARPRPLPRRHRVGLTAFTALMCLVVAAPVALGLRYIDAHTRAVDRIFAQERDPVSSAQGSGTVRGPVVEQEDPWEGTERVNVLLLGSDAGWNREGVRTDSMIVASMDTQGGEMVLFSIPRNLQNVPIPADSPLRNAWPSGHYDCGAECLMNGIWTEAEAQAEAHPEWFAGQNTPGRTATRDVIGEVLGMPIQYTVIVNLDGFEQLVDAIGGVRINVQERVPIGGQTYTDAQGRAWLVEGSENGWIELGPQLLDGRKALWYARSRVTTDDYSRMRRQRCMVAALVDQVEPMTMLRRYPAIASAAGDNMSVDIPQQELPAWAELVRRVQAAGIKSLPFTLQNTNVANPNFASIRLQVHEALNPQPEPEAPTTPDDAVRTTSPDDAERTSVPDDVQTTTDPVEDPQDELVDVGAVC